MEKLKTNVWARIIAGVLLVIALEMAFVSGVLTLGFYSRCGYIPNNKEDACKHIIKEIAQDYSYELSGYYTAVLMNDTFAIREYENQFSKQNSNLAFEIVPETETATDKDLPTLKNFELTDTQYQGIFEQFVDYDYQYKELRIPLQKEEILACLAACNDINIVVNSNLDAQYYSIEETQESWVTEEEGLSYDEDYTGTEAEMVIFSEEEYPADEDEYKETKYYDVNDFGGLSRVNSDNKNDMDVKYGMYHSNDEDFHILSDTITFYGEYPDIYLTDDLDEFGVYIPDLDNTYYFPYNSTVMNRVKHMVEYIENNSDMYNYYTYYDAYAEEIVVDFDSNKSVLVSMYLSVDSELTAHDNFYTSWTLWLINHFYGASIPVFIISVLIAFFMSVFVVMAAGHTKDSETIKLGYIDKIPYDILLVIPVLMLMYIVNEYNYYGFRGYFDSRLRGFMVVGIALLFIPPFLSTTAARSKTGAIFTNTVVWRVLKLVWKIVKFLGIKIGYGVCYVIKHMNICWKSILAYILVFLMNMIVTLLCMNSGETGLWLIFFMIFGAAILAILIKTVVDMNKLKKGGMQLAGGNSDYKIDTDRMFWEFKNHGEQLNCIGDGIQGAVEEQMKSERMKTELITNVSHDIKTPLTSIINYVDLLEKENIENEKAKEYLEVLDRQSARLKKLIEDLIDASKASTGNMTVNLETVDIGIMLGQAEGEFGDKLDAGKLKIKENYRSCNKQVIADGKLLWRVIANIFSNICKYAEPGSRVYIDIDSMKDTDDRDKLMVAFKNISKEELNISGDELMERFVRGDSSRNTEGSGLGLSIAKSLMELMDGNLDIIVDGDLFKVIIVLNVAI